MHQADYDPKTDNHAVSAPNRLNDKSSDKPPLNADPASPLFTFAVLTADTKGASGVEERLFIPSRIDGSRFWLVYGGWKESSQFIYDDKRIHTADGYIIHGQFPDFVTSDVLNHIFSSGKPIIYFFDESLPELASAELRAKIGFRKYLSECLKHAHLVVVENEFQKNVYKALNNRITALPPKLDANQYAPVSPARDGVVKVVYRGDDGHLGNLLLISEALREVGNRHPGKLEFHFFGRGLQALGEHPAYHFHAKPSSHHEWEDTLKRIQPDFALTPLEGIPDKQLSSILPLLEYAAYGIPLMASNVQPYHDYLEHGSTGFLVENSTAAWVTALEEFLAKPQEQVRMSHTVRQWLEKNHSLPPKHTGMVDVFEQVLANARAARFSKPLLDFETLHKQTPYQKYLSAQRLLTRDKRWMEEEIKHWSKSPRFHLLITLLPGQTQWLRNTVDSLYSQIYPQWKLTIVAFTTMPEELALGSQVRWYELNDEEDSYEALNQLAQEEEFDWVGFVEAGDILQQHALFKLAFHSIREPGWRIVYTDEDEISHDSIRSNPLFKPDYNPDLLHSYPYTGNFCLFDRKLFSQLGGVDGEQDGIEVYDLLLRCTEQLASNAIGHLAEVLFSRFELGGHSIRPLSEIHQQGVQALRNHFARRRIAAEIKTGALAGTHEITYPLYLTPLVSILIPTRDHLELIKPCVDSLLEKTDYPNYEILVLNNDSRDGEVLSYFKEISKNSRIRVLDYPHPFNFSAICNFGAEQAKGEFLLLLNNDTEALHPEWLSEMVRHGLRSEVGVVGARLLFPDRSVQHAGVIMGLGGIADHPFTHAGVGLPGYMKRAQLVQNYSAVTGACMLVRKDTYQSLGAMDASELKVLYNDVDFCLRAREAGLLVVWTPYANLIHKASVSIEKVMESPTISTQRAQAYGEHHTMCKRWLNWMAFDPAYNRNLTQESNHLNIELDHALSWDPDWRPATRVIAYPGDLEGCGEYRIIGPCRALNEAGLVQAHVSEKLYYPGQLAKIDPDVIILQRQVEDNHLDAIGEIKRYSRAFRVFEIDDLLHDLPTKSIHRAAMHGDELERLIEGISQSDRFVTTSPVLADAYGRYCNDVRIVPNFLERAKWGQLTPTRLQGKKPRVGWAGGISHTGDLLQLYPVIKTLHKEVDWIFFGMCPEPLRPYIKEFHGPVKLDFYPAKLASLNLDLALAPLEYSHFNEAKSALKILEYGVLGYPVICTDITTYQGDFPVTRVPNKPQEWIDAIRDAISDRDSLSTNGDALRNHIQSHWMLEENLDKWLDAWLP